MPRRPRQHVLEALARAELHKAFAKQGWTAEDLSQDYGEDLLVRIFSHGAATPLSFFVQSKSTDRVVKVIHESEECVRVRVSTEHVAHWNEIRQPVLLTLFEASTAVTYWEIVQDASLPDTSLNASKPAKTASIYLPTRNTLEPTGLRRISYRTRRRHDQYLLLRKGAEQLVEALRETVGLEITYEPDGVICIPMGKFEPSKDGSKLFFFGPLAEKLQRAADNFGMTSDSFLHASLDAMRRIAAVYEQGRMLMLRSPEGEIIEQWATLREFGRHLQRFGEDKDENEL